LQQEWQFVQRVIKEIGGKFTEIEKAISQAFLPALFGDVLDEDDPRLALANLPVKHAGGLAIPNPVRSSDMNYEASILASSHLAAGVEKFHSSDHLAVIPMSGTPSSNLAMRWSLLDKELRSIVSKLSCDDQRTILQGKDTSTRVSG
jgi:hypothetical protein